MANRLGGGSSGGGGTALTPVQAASLAAIPLKADQSALDDEIAATDLDIGAHDTRLIALEGEAANDAVRDTRLDALEADQLTQDTALTTEVTTTDAEQAAQDARLDAIEAGKTAQDTALANEIATTDAEQTAQDARLDALETSQTAQDVALAAEIAATAAGQLAQNTQITALETSQGVQDTELARLETDKADRTELPRNLTDVEATDGADVEFGLTNGTQIAQSVRDHSPLPSFVINDAALALIDVTALNPFEERFNRSTRQFAIYHPSDTTGDVTPNVGPGSWFYVGSEKRTLQDTVDGQELQWQNEYILHPGFKYVFPVVTEDFGTNWIVALPDNQNWQVGFDSANDWSAPDAQTIGATQTEAISATAGELRFIGRTGTPANIEVFINSGLNTTPAVGVDSSAPIDTTQPLSPDDTVLVRVPDTGAFVTGAPQSTMLQNGALVELRPLTDIGPNFISTPITSAQVLLFELVGQGGATAAPKNPLEPMTADFTAVPVNDSGTGADGRVYMIAPDVNLTFPPISDMDPANGIYRVRFATDWGLRALEVPAPTYITDGTDGLAVPGGWPISGSRFVDVIADTASSQWVVT